MSFDPSNLSHEQIMEEYAKDNNRQLRFLNAQIKEAFGTEIELDDVRILEDYEDGT